MAASYVRRLRIKLYFKSLGRIRLWAKTCVGFEAPESNTLIDTSEIPYHAVFGLLPMLRVK